MESTGDVSGESINSSASERCLGHQDEDVTADTASVATYQFAHADAQTEEFVSGNNPPSEITVRSAEAK